VQTGCEQANRVEELSESHSFTHGDDWFSRRLSTKSSEMPVHLFVVVTYFNTMTITDAVITTPSA